MWFLFVLSALASDMAWAKTLRATPTLTANAVFAETVLKPVGTLASGKVSYTLKCGTLTRLKTCAVVDKAGVEVARTTNIVTDAGDGFTATFDANPGFVFHTINY